MDTTPLAAELQRRIKRAGPMPVRQYMALCLSHAEHGYYMTRDPFGRTGDFVTSPEVSQIFGELVGLWAAAVWRMMGEPENVRLVELGPGRGTMMADALRASQVVPAFRKAIVAHLVEISPALQSRQAETLSGFDVPMLWHETFEEVPPGPVIVLANEFFDALPVSQAVKQINGWYERTIELDAEDNFVFGIADEQIPLFEQFLPPKIRDASLGSLYEWRADSTALGLSRRVVNQGGAALVIDYGHDESAVGETLQAVGNHAFADPLTAVGTVDVTAHVDFEALARDAESMGAHVSGPTSQARFLINLGLQKRAESLKAHADPDKAADIDAAVARLTGAGETGMGTMFKAIGLGDPRLGMLPGFEPRRVST